MALIDKATVKLKFTRWESFARLTAAEDSADVEARVDNAIADGETKLLEYVTVTDETITDQLTLHLMCIIKKFLFDIKHGDTAWERTPQIVKDYNDCIALLERYKDGEFAVPDDDPDDDTPKEVRITAKARRFGGKWFNDRSC